MDIRLSWDLFILVFLAMVLAYSFIVGRKQTVKIILATYVAFLAADGLGFFIRDRIGFRIPAMLFGVDSISAGVLTSIILFMIFIVVLARHHLFDVSYEDNSGTFVYTLTTIYIGLLSAALMLACILFFLSGNTFTIFAQGVDPSAIFQITSQSWLARLIIDWFHVWFFLPALSLVVYSFFGKKE